MLTTRPTRPRHGIYLIFLEALNPFIQLSIQNDFQKIRLSSNYLDEEEEEEK